MLMRAATNRRCPSSARGLGEGRGRWNASSKLRVSRPGRDRYGHRGQAPRPPGMACRPCAPLGMTCPMAANVAPVRPVHNPSCAHCLVYSFVIRDEGASCDIRVRLTPLPYRPQRSDDPTGSCGDPGPKVSPVQRESVPKWPTADAHRPTGTVRPKARRSDNLPSVVGTPLRPAGACPSTVSDWEPRTTASSEQRALNGAARRRPPS